MNCKNCGEPIHKNRIKRSPEPFVYHPYKHFPTNLIGCFDGHGDPTGTKAEPAEEVNG